MLYHIEGTVTDFETNLAVMDCGGLGYALNASLNTISGLKLGERAKLYVCECIREDAHELFGFLTKEEKRCFEMLIGISGVGPKAAISILSSNTPASLALAVLNGDIKALTCAPGIGKKIAQRIVLELKDMLAKEAASNDFVSALPVVSVQPEESSTRADTIAALTVLGYSMPEINAALRTLQTEEMTVEQAVKAALRAMMQ